MKIKMQLIPRPCYGRNLRSVLEEEDWVQISRAVRSDCTCAICKRKFSSISKLEAHEEWVFKKGKQTLKRILPLCKKCHRAIHIGHTAYEVSDKKYKKIRKWYCKINHCNKEQFYADRREAYRQWAILSNQNWKWNKKNEKAAFAYVKNIPQKERSK